ncbi:zinc metalloproteinase-disintegrin-like berythractivase [Ranitomeya imitator]|uniref:zinc metalloproteinase-disintegrin-like berythractivase n=1 Tax=Ranitomeya imitator TaxID=111125 RepID=UPI0037E8AFA5
MGPARLRQDPGSSAAGFTAPRQPGPPESAACSILLHTMERVAKGFGVPLAADKTVGPVTTLSFLGIEIDTVAMECRLPDDKLVAFREEVRKAMASVSRAEALLGFSVPGMSSGAVEPAFRAVKELFARSLSERSWLQYEQAWSTWESWKVSYGSVMDDESKLLLLVGHVWESGWSVSKAQSPEKMFHITAEFSFIQGLSGQPGHAVAKRSTVQERWMAGGAARQAAWRQREPGQQDQEDEAAGEVVPRHGTARQMQAVEPLRGPCGGRGIGIDSGSWHQIRRLQERDVLRICGRLLRTGRSVDPSLGVEPDMIKMFRKRILTDAELEELVNASDSEDDVPQEIMSEEEDHISEMESNVENSDSEVEYEEEHDTQTTSRMQEIPSKNKIMVIRRVRTMLRHLLLVLVLLVFAQLPGGQTYEVVFPRRLHTVYKRDTQSIYPDVLQYEIHLRGKPTVIHIEKTEGLFAEDYTESNYLEDGTLVTSRPEHQDHCNYQGYVKHENDSMVILSTCNGLSGLIQTQGQNFFIEPLMSTESQEHAVYEQVELPMRSCGVSENSTKQKPPSIASFRASVNEKENLWITKKYIELFLVADLSMYNKYGRNIDNVKMHLFGVVNYMNKVYKTINIFVALIGIEIWDSTNQINVVSDYSVLLQRFQEWRIQNLLPRRPHDNAQFITNVDFDGSIIGLATVSGMCGANSAGVIQDHNTNAASVGSTVAHEMGHNLGMYHDDLNSCTCGAPACVMTPILSYPPPLAFSSCSTSDMRSFIYTYFPDCLLNIPQTSQVLTPPVCGNKFIENGEQCDCGEPQECTSNSCDAKTCTLKPGCQCDEADLCCQDCKIKPAGSICRPAKDECDLTDMCDGRSPECPKDSFKVNGFPCENGNGACYMGKCPVMRNQCMDIWGPGAIPGGDDCFSMNTQGAMYGYCRQEGQRYVPCGKADVKCGLLYCSGVTKSPNSPGYIISFGQCKTLVFNKGIVAEGTKCNATNVCINNKCTKIEEAYITAGCESKCTGHAI